MGTKRILAPKLADIIGESPSGPLLDLFSGICAIASAVAPSRQVWCNDTQAFSSTVAKILFLSSPLILSNDQAADVSYKYFDRNFVALKKRFSTYLIDEKEALLSACISRIESLEYDFPNIASERSLDCERAWLAKHPKCFPYRLFSLSYSGAYLGIRQCIEIDSIRYAIDSLLSFGKIDQDQHRWMCICLCQAMSKVSTTTGHFAQHMRINKKKCYSFHSAALSFDLARMVAGDV